jgi:hypothetical protein
LTYSSLIYINKEKLRLIAFGILTVQAVGILQQRALHQGINYVAKAKNQCSWLTALATLKERIRKKEKKIVYE